MDEDKILEETYRKERNLLLRDYQVKLINHAINQNSIIYLPAGSGKTIIAINVLLSRTTDLTRPNIELGKKAFFIATTKVLVVQLASVLIAHTKFNVSYYTGDMNVDAWSQDIWEKQLQNNHVLVMTAEILRRLLILHYVNPLQISLIVLDECHHAFQNHPYSGIMKALSHLDDSEMPRILGLSACLLNTSTKNVTKKLHELEITLRSTILTELEMVSVLGFAANPEEILVTYRTESSVSIDTVLVMYDKAIALFDEISVNLTNSCIVSPETALEKNEDKLNDMKKCLVNSKFYLTEFGVYGGSVAALYFVIMLEKYRITSTNALDIEAALFARTERVLAKIMSNAENADTIYEFSSPKVKKFIDIIRDKRELADKGLLSLLTFVYRRATAVILSNILKKLSSLDERLNPIKPDFVVSTTHFNTTGFHLKSKNEEIVRRFSSKELNVLIATNVLEEGIDVSACNVVISYDFPIKFASYIQSRGRARNKDSVYYIFSNKEKNNQDLDMFQEIKTELESAITNTTQAEDYGLNSSAEDETLSLTRDGVSVVVDGSMAIQCVHRYCFLLPQDRFAFLSPIVWYNQRMTKKSAFIQLPTNSGIQFTIEGDEKTNFKSAKKSAFLKAVKILYQMNKIDLNLQSKSFDNGEIDFQILLPHYVNENIDMLLPQPGTKKRIQMYNSKYPQCLSKSIPKPESKAYLHVMNFTVAFDKPKLDRRVTLYELLQRSHTYGILTSKRLSKICQFPLFLSMGQINCDFLVNIDEFVFNSSELDDIKLFHFTLFSKVLGVLKEYHAYDNRNEENSYFVVPLRQNDQKYVLNWELIRSDFCKPKASAVVRYNPSSENARKETNDSYGSDDDNSEELSSRKSLVPKGVVAGKLLWTVTGQKEKKSKPNFILTEATYTNFVISPNYRPSYLQQYYVASSFCYNMTPLSPFPREEYNDFYEYYKDKYDIQIVNLEQPLLKVSLLPNCANFNRVITKESNNKAKVKEFEELFVPELCNIYPFLKAYWLKGVLVPTVLNRISHIYRVDELRRRIAEETGLGPTEIPENGMMKPLVPDNSWLNSQRNNLGITTEPLKLQTQKLEDNLPMSQLKKQTDANVLKDVNPERNLFEIGLCDLENFIELLHSADPEEEVKEINKLRGNDEIIATLNVPNIPKLRTLTSKITECSGPELSLMVQAFTATSANDIFNYERQEMLGDSFLKFASSLFIFREFPNHNEGILSFVKGKLVSNKNLLYCGLAKKLTDYINVNDFSPMSGWNPPLFSLFHELKKEIIWRNVESTVVNSFSIPHEEQLSGNLSDVTLKTSKEIIEKEQPSMEMESAVILGRETINDKTVSDVVEALIGTYLLEFGVMGGFMILNWLDILPHNTGSFDELMVKPFEFNLMNNDNIDGDDTIDILLSGIFQSKLEEVLDYKFKNQGLLLEALTHPSYSKNRITNCYQRLEFLGDSILDFLITTYLYENCENLGPGQITDIRSSLVNNITFGCYAVRYELHKYLLSLSSPLMGAIEHFVKFQASNGHVINENTLIHLEENDCLMAETVTVPKALGDLFESLAGAVFLDSGNSLETVWRVYYRLMKQEIDEFIRKTPKTPVRLLHEYCSQKPIFKTIISETAVIVACTVYHKDCEITTHGFGDNKKKAKMSACKLALKKVMEIS
ncbi:hypothetical protein RUM44_000456 [Polyplax serrata]|uniref:Dicer-2 n=1 Tax=Polyplax serrata TaxID=468196 RepID=A0ABR1B8D5_POLSC